MTNYYLKFLLSFLGIGGWVMTITAQVAITFQVDMNYQIVQGKFNKNTEWVEVAGTFNDWNGSGRFQDTDGDGIYSLTIGGFQKGENIAYKFRYNGRWDGREEFPGLGNDRTHTVGESDETLYHWYNNETPPDADLVADFNANYQEIYEQGEIYFLDRSSGQVTSWEWTFSGGTPSSSTLKNPVVRYNKAGNYDVQLNVTKGDQSNTVILENYINVLPRNTSVLPWWNETVFYEIFVRSFKDSDGDGIGDFKGLTEQLDYLNDGDPNTTDDLGITGIWLMPIHEAGSYHGYDVIDYQSISSDYGTLDDFKTFLDEAHQRGIKVIIDWVINHNSSQSAWFQNAQTSPNAEYRNFYRWEDTNPNYSGPWGQQVWHQKNGDYYYGLFWDGMPDLNYAEPRVKSAIFDAADFWLEEIGVDGFRLDAVKFIIEEDRKLEDTQSTFLFWQEFSDRVKAANKDAFSVGEAWTNTETILNYVKNDRIDYCFEFDLAGTILNAVNEGRADYLYGQMQKMYSLYPHLQYATFLANHDQNRIMNTLNQDETKVKLAAAIYLTLPGIPYIYYGEEIGMIGQKPDEDIRLPMQWNEDSHAGFTEGIPWRSIHGSYTTYNVAEESETPNSLLNHYKQLIQLRNSEKALQVGTYEAVLSNNTKIFAYLRQYEGETILVVHNTDVSATSDLVLKLNHTNLAVGNWSLIDRLNNDNLVNIAIANNELRLPLTLAGRATKVFKLTKVVSLKNVDNQDFIKVFPNPVKDDLYIKVEGQSGQSATYQIYDLQGRVVATGILKLTNDVSLIPVDNLPIGKYHLQLEIGTTLRQISFIKQEY